MSNKSGCLVSIVIPVHNGSAFIKEALESILKQSWKESLEVSIFDDCSTDDSYKKLLTWKDKFENNGIHVVLSQSQKNEAGGVGFAKNCAISQSSGNFICFLDIDDIMHEKRIELQLSKAKEDTNLIVGSGYVRLPEGSTVRYTEWSNSLSDSQLYTQIYTSFGPTIINPTWFCSRDVIKNTGYFQEVQKGFPEDLEFFYRHLDNNGKLALVKKPLLTYRYHSAGATFSVHEDTIWDLRMKQIQKNVISKWGNFTIWNAGKQGRKFYRSLDPENREKVLCMCDVDDKKIQKGVYTCEMIKGADGKPLKVPIVHFKDARKPFIICVKLGMSNGVFEDNLSSLCLEEGKDFFHFN
ncbi:queuosine-tRNA galactosyltransferase-like [Clytia hemisphaerica]|uniref:Glycosyltransferase 2-like domain-containing protein n=1 Tax=Clytia hemisphaerica TaxID=252671 RepID=A0A7M5UZT1_9CNID